MVELVTIGEAVKDNKENVSGCVDGMCVITPKGKDNDTERKEKKS